MIALNLGCLISGFLMLSLCYLLFKLVRVIANRRLPAEMNSLLQRQNILNAFLVGLSIFLTTGEIFIACCIPIVFTVAILALISVK